MAGMATTRYVRTPTATATPTRRGTRSGRRLDTPDRDVSGLDADLTMALPPWRCCSNDCQRRLRAPTQAHRGRSSLFDGAEDLGARLGVPKPRDRDLLGDLLDVADDRIEVLQRPPPILSRRHELPDPGPEVALNLRRVLRIRNLSTWTRHIFKRISESRRRCLRAC